jgi:glycerate-2-kinase
VRESGEPLLRRVLLPAARQPHAQGKGRGGRNQELAWGRQPNCRIEYAFLVALATDGEDGPPTPPARLYREYLSAAFQVDESGDFLKQNNAYCFLRRW